MSTTLPLVAAAVFVLGCCVLPFHRVVHSLMPMCQTAAGLVHEHDDDHHPVSTPANEKKDERASRWSPSDVTTRQGSEWLPAHVATVHVAQTRAANRSFISLGAVRCDQDVGLRLILLDTFRI